MATSTETLRAASLTHTTEQCSVSSIQKWPFDGNIYYVNFFFFFFFFIEHLYPGLPTRLGAVTNVGSCTEYYKIIYYKILKNYTYILQCTATIGPN